MLHRKWFFWIDRLKISRAERIAVTTLMGFSLILAMVSFLYEPAFFYGKDDYEKLDRYFERRLQVMQKKEAVIEARYRGKKALSDPIKDEHGRSEKVDINKAGSNALQTLSGIGPALAERIISYRDSKGAFEKIADLLNVKGIGDATLNKMRPHIRRIPEHKNSN